MLSNMHSTTVFRRCCALKERALHLVHSRVFHSQRKLKYVFIHFRYISFSQLYFLSLLLEHIWTGNCTPLPTVAKRASYMILHFRPGWKVFFSSSPVQFFSQQMQPEMVIRTTARIYIHILIHNAGEKSR